jgi:hypothetical protein
LRKQGVRKMVTMRDFFFRRFGAGQPELIQERVRLYLMGMPDHNGAAFPPPLRYGGETGRPGNRKGVPH